MGTGLDRGDLCLCLCLRLARVFFAVGVAVATVNAVTKVVAGDGI